MNKILRDHLHNLHDKDTDRRYESFRFIIELTNQPVDWAYEAWDDLLLLTRNGDNHQRTIAVQALSNLAKSDPDQRMLKDLDALLVVTRDEKFVTARHSLQCLWKVGIASEKLKEEVVSQLSKRFNECIVEKNCTLIRYDILEVFRKMYDQVKDERLKEYSLQLIETVDDPKYRKKYLGLWKGV